MIEEGDVFAFLIGFGLGAATVLAVRWWKAGGRDGRPMDDEPMQLRIGGLL